MRDDHGGGMAAVARHRNPSAAIRGLVGRKGLVGVADQRPQCSILMGLRFKQGVVCSLARCVGRCGSFGTSKLADVVCGPKAPKSQ